MLLPRTYVRQKIPADSEITLGNFDAKSGQMPPAIHLTIVASDTASIDIVYDVVIVIIVIYYKNMNSKENIFINTLLRALIDVEDHLSEQGLQENNVKDAMKDLSGLVRQVAGKNFGDLQAGRQRYYVGRLFPTLQRMATQWYKQFMRRISVRCKVLNPWKVVLEVSVPKELFVIMKDIGFETMYGLHYS